MNRYSVVLKLRGSGVERFRCCNYEIDDHYVRFMIFDDFDYDESLSPCSVRIVPVHAITEFTVTLDERVKKGNYMYDIESCDYYNRGTLTPEQAKRVLDFIKTITGESDESEYDDI